MSERTCSIDGCGKIHYGRGWCQTHWSRWRRTGTTERRLPKVGMPCAVEGCPSPSLARGWCKTHYHRWSRHGDPLRVLLPEEQSNWRGGRTLSGSGYVEVRVTQDDPLCGQMAMRGRKGYALEHRVVMARHIGRALRREETVHHINGDRTDNRPENLELWSSSQPSGQRVEDKLAWAREIIALYGDD